MLPAVPRLAFAIGLILGLATVPLLAQEHRQPGERADPTPHKERLEALMHGTVGAAPPPLQTVVTSGTNALAIDGHFDLDGYIFKDGTPFVHADGGSQYNNTALGLNALVSSTPGYPASYSATRNTAVGTSALRYNTEGSYNTASGASALRYNTTGVSNTAHGSQALRYNTTGNRNTASGNLALFANTEGDLNTASGHFALANNTTGLRNTASGAFALDSNTMGSENTASGAFALHYNTTGYLNTAVGYEALFSNETGSRNIGLGDFAGGQNTDGSDNIWIGSFGSIESNTLRMGNGTGTAMFQQNRAFISGIRNATLSMTGEQQVCVDDVDQVGPCSISSARFKHYIRAMGEASAGIEDLRPVVFKYRPEVKDDAETEHFGLIAEEVAEIYPHLVTTDAEGRPFSVRYDLLTPLLLNELQAQQRVNVKRDRDMAALAKRNAGLEARLRRLEALVVGDP